MVLEQSDLISFESKYNPTDEVKVALDLPEVELYYYPNICKYILWYGDTYDCDKERFDTYEEGLDYVYNRVMGNEIELCCESYLKLLKEINKCQQIRY